MRRITASIHHRGPDQQNVFISPHICLGAVRLKIIDLENGDQPLISADGSTVIVFNGEIYNHGALREELEALGHRFRSRCDTEVVLEAFREWDVKCFAKLRGMFAVALWSEPTRRLVLARDRMGIKPLYTYRRGKDLYFGSELKCILEHQEIPRELDHEALADFLAVNYVPGCRTLVRGLTKHPAGHVLEHREGMQRVQAYWSVDCAPVANLRLDEAKEELDGLLRESVREHLMADVPAGLWLSGGVDSSTILHYASEAGLRRPKTFSIAFESQCCDERRYSRDIASRYGTEHHELELRADLGLAGAIEDMASHSDEPGADAGALPMWFLARMTAEHVTVALSGDGGDELFGGYLTYAADRWSRYLRWAPMRLRRLALAAAERWLPVSDKKIGFEYKAKRLLRGSMLRDDEAHFFWNGTFSMDERARLLRNSSVQVAGRQRLGGTQIDQLPGSREVGRLNRYMLLDQLTYLPDNILYKVDRMSMAHSLEVRPAFLDHRIVEFAARLPEKFKMRGRSQKIILKQLMKGKLPAGILSRGKQGFDIPTHDWFRGVLKPLLLDTLSTSRIESTGLFHSAAIRQLISDHMSRRVNAGYHLWGLMTLMLWLRRWKIEVAPVDEYFEAEPVRVYGT